MLGLFGRQDTLQSRVLALLMVGAAEAEIVACFRHAIEVACQQDAKSWELRATMSLCRLWQKQGKGEEARQILAEIYGWFSEGFDTPDLKEAKALLDELSQARRALPVSEPTSNFETAAL